ncbi:IS630 family transposase [Pseudonocardia sp. MH-G8]|uniref:IS630 family transposase n=1 Tax=Pseudonocardia sp. MH-G8 TaxID=1854588 RepID=UPI001E351599|nr:IS630 family transposase [Pseudonocardia sp. MH-G8]
MARQPEVFVRKLDPAEAQRLVKITRTARDRVRLRRAGIVLASVQGRSATEAAAMFAATAQYAREVIHAFNDKGFAALDPKWSGGRPPKFGPHARELICRVARTPPQQVGLPFTTWSLSKLVEHLRERHRIEISTDTVRRILRTARVRWQATKTWKSSKDPQFAEKMARILELYDRSAAGQLTEGARVVCVDEFGPLNLQPRPGRAGSPAAVRHGCGRPTTATAVSGTCSPGSISPPVSCSTGCGIASAGRSSSRSCASSGPRFPTGRLHVVCDNFSPHRKAEVADWCASNDVELVFTPTHASWLNWIEAGPGGL